MIIGAMDFDFEWHVNDLSDLPSASDRWSPNLVDTFSCDENVPVSSNMLLSHEIDHVTTLSTCSICNGTYTCSLVRHTFVHMESVHFFLSKPSRGVGYEALATVSRTSQWTLFETSLLRHDFLTPRCHIRGDCENQRRTEANSLVASAALISSAVPSQRGCKSKQHVMIRGSDAMNCFFPPFGSRDIFKSASYRLCQDETSSRVMSFG
jgi:hypothetical protein